MEIVIKVTYFATKFLDTDYGLPEGVVAQVTVLAKKDWTSRQVVSYGAVPYAAGNSGVANSRFRYMYGMRFVFKEGSKGKFGYFVPLAFGALLAVISVYLRGVNLFLRIFATHALGDTSRAYSRAQREIMNMDRDSQQIGPAKLLIAAAAFKSLIASADPVKGKRVIDGKETLTEMGVHDLFINLFQDILEEHDIEKFARITYDSIASCENFGERLDLRAGKAQRGHMEKYEELTTKGAPVGVDLQAFMFSACKGEVFDLTQFSHLFASGMMDRAGCLEVIFGESDTLLMKRISTLERAQQRLDNGGELLKKEKEEEEDNDKE